MKTSPECIPCFTRQIRYAARLATDDPEGEEQVIEHALSLLSSIDMDLSPPENAIAIYGVIAEASGCPDPFAALKEQSTRAALCRRAEFARLVAAADDPLRVAVSLAIAGNIIDYGSQQHFDLERAVGSCLEKGFARDQYSLFRDDLEKVPTDGFILYLADNCGELVFDGLVIELLAAMGKKVVLALKESPVINDALVDDARASGLEKICDLVSNGTSCPGTPLDLCSRKFRDFFEAADLIISKGQGNFETLSLVPGPIYFLLTVKCSVVAGHLGECVGKGMAAPQEGDFVLVRRQG